MNSADKNWSHLKKIKYLRNKKFQNTFLIKVGVPVQYFSKNFFLERFDQFSTLKYDFETQNFEMFEEVVHKFCKSDTDIILLKMLISSI